jgi:hypothetical protein
MATTLAYTDVRSEARAYLPSIVAYNRIEARPRTTDFTRSLRAEVRDPLWMLTRQFQFGEFRGEDAASPVTARVAYRHYRTGLVALRDANAFRFDPAKMPLETRVEREPVAMNVRMANGEEYSDLLFAVRWGKRLLDRMRDAGLEMHYEMYRANFSILVLRRAESEDREEDAEAEAIWRSTAGRIADGVAIWRAVLLGKHDDWLDDQAIMDAPALKTLLKEFADECSHCVDRLFTQPASAEDSAWLSKHLEYKFATSPQPLQQESLPTLYADQYCQGHLDWYSFDAFMNRPLQPTAGEQPAADGVGDVDEETVESFLPAPVRFKGQPQPRFWEMEEAQTDFGKIDTSATGLLHLLLAEFGLVYSNDWFMLPHPMDINTLCEVRGILVSDTFGRHTFIRAAGRGPETDWQRFAMFHLTEHGNRPDAAGSLFYLAPAVGHALESAPIERVNFLRDEMANMAWGVEAIIPSQTGQGMSGYEAAGPPVGEEGEPRYSYRIENDDVKIAYVAGTTVPGNWIPFIPVHAEGSVSEIRLQRARMAGGTLPRGRLLREVKSPYFIEEEEVPRAGAYVERSWQRVRWLGGRTLIWIGRRKTAGRGEGASNLMFDRIRDLAPPQA